MCPLYLRVRINNSLHNNEKSIPRSPDAAYGRSLGFRPVIRRFFQQNQKCGYVLKPKKLLPESTHIEIYDKPIGTLLVTIQSIVNVVRVLEKAKKPLQKKFKMELSCWVVGALEDDKNNKKYTFKVSENYLFPELLNNEEMKFNIYEKDLGAIFFKLTYDDDLIGRAVIPFCMMKNGVRRVKFYTNLCEELSFSFLIAEIKKVFD